MCVSKIEMKFKNFCWLFSRKNLQTHCASSFTGYTDLESNYRLIRTIVYRQSDCIKHLVKVHVVWRWVIFPFRDFRYDENDKTIKQRQPAVY